MGLQRRVALVGFDDVVLANAVEPALSVVAQDPMALGRSAAELLLARLDGDASPSRQVTLAAG
jgi:LacI family transcriptional regulator